MLIRGRLANLGNGRGGATDFRPDIADNAADLVKFVGHVRLVLMSQNPGDLLDRAAAHIGGDDHPGPISDHSGDGISSAQAKHLVPHDHFPEINDHPRSERRPDDRGVPAALLGRHGR